nr:MAG TPA: hypothetical protein [Caudoviricetes sp.]
MVIPSTKEQRPGAIRAAAFLCRFRHSSQYVHSIARNPTEILIKC